MKIIKKAFSVLSLVLILASSNLATASDNPINWKSQMVSYLSQLDIPADEAPDKILVDFMISDNFEIIVISTSEKELDKQIKAKLNYKKLVSKDLVRGKKYTLPIIFDKV